MRLQDFSIRARLLAGFGFVLALSAAGTAVVLWELRMTGRNVEDMIRDDVAKIQLSQQMSEAVHIVATVTRTLVLLDDAPSRAAEGNKMMAARRSYDQAWATFDAMSGSESGLALRRKIREAKLAAQPLNEQVLQLAETEQDAQALRLLLDQAGPATQRWQEALDANIDFQVQSKEAAYEQVLDSMALMENTLLALGLLSVLSGLGIALVITRSAVAPLQSAVEVAGRIAEGDLNSRVEVIGRDEIARLARAMGDMQTSLARIVLQVRDSAAQLAATSEQIAGGNLDLSQRTEEQASSLEQTASAMEQLNATVRQNADNAQVTNTMALQASTLARSGGEEVARVVQTMHGIHDSSRRIGDIITVIDSIAFQTNILALNAAVEAARAGEAGRGFAVVATEVRSLAARSAVAAKEIKTLITDSLQRVDEGNAQVEKAGQTVAQVVQAIERVSATIADISTASAEQTQGVQQIGQAISHLDQATQQNAALVEEMAAAAERLNQQAGELVNAVAVFKLRDVVLVEPAPAKTSGPIGAAARLAM